MKIYIINNVYACTEERLIARLKDKLWTVFITNPMLGEKTELYNGDDPAMICSFITEDYAQYILTEDTDHKDKDYDVMGIFGVPCEKTVYNIRAYTLIS